MEDSLVIPLLVAIFALLFYCEEKTHPVNSMRFLPVLRVIISVALIVFILHALRLYDQGVYNHLRSVLPR